MIHDRRPPEEAAEWLRFADSDLAAARAILGADPTLIRQPLQLAQQCAEKALKGFLIAKGRQYPLTHNINTLRTLCIAIDGTLDTATIACVDLTPYASGMRYPGDPREPTFSETLASIVAVEALLDAVKQRVGMQ
jgi:HEPN domain-containing protein